VATAGEPPPTAPSLERFLDWPHDRLSALVEDVARGADGLLSGNRLADAPTGSYVSLGGATTVLRAGDGEDTTRAITRVKLALPRTEERLQLLVDRGLSSLTRSDAQRDAEVSLGQAPVDDSPFAALRLLAVDRLKLRIGTDVGARFRIPFDPFARLRADRSTALGPWTLLFSETLLTSRLTRFQSTTQFALQRAFSPSLALTLLSDATWRETSRRFDLSQTATLLWQVQDRTLLGFEAGVLGITRPDAVVTAWTLSLRLRHRLHRDWLLFEARPQILFPRDRGFQPVPTLTLQLEAFFGAGYLL
jgi:hypothetical protein